MVDLSKLSDVVKNDVVKKYVYNAKIKDIEDKIPNTTNVATNTTLNAKMNEVNNEICRITNFVTTASLNAKINVAKNKIPNITNLTTTTTTLIVAEYVLYALKLNFSLQQSKV